MCSFSSISFFRDGCLKSVQLCLVISFNCFTATVSFQLFHCSCYSRGGQKNKSQKFDGCPMNSHFIGLGLLRTVFETALQLRGVDLRSVGHSSQQLLPENNFWIFPHLNPLLNERVWRDRPNMKSKC